MTLGSEILLDGDTEVGMSHAWQVRSSCNCSGQTVSSTNARCSIVTSGDTKSPRDGQKRSGRKVPPSGVNNGELLDATLYGDSSGLNCGTPKKSPAEEAGYRCRVA